jgi:hypothetical protein
MNCIENEGALQKMRCAARSLIANLSMLVLFYSLTLNPGSVVAGRLDQT